MIFQRGSEVTWTDQRHATMFTGTIVAVVQPRQLVEEALRVARVKAILSGNHRPPRGHRSYVVSVGGKLLYPRVSTLREVDPQPKEIT